MSYKNTDGSTQTNAIWDDPGQSPTRSHLCSERQTYRSLIVVLKRSLIVPFNKAYRRRDWNGISNSAFKWSRTCVRNRRIGNKPTHSQWKDWSWWMLQLKIRSDRNEIEMSSCKRKLTRSALHLVRVVPSGSKRHWQMENGCAFFCCLCVLLQLAKMDGWWSKWHRNTRKGNNILWATGSGDGFFPLMGGILQKLAA